MPHKFDPQNNHLLVADDRQLSVDTHRVLSLLPINRYHSVADVGCGPGYFTLPLAKYLFDGRVYALDIQQEMLDAASAELNRVRLSNVDVMLTHEDRLPLEDGSVDGAFIAFAIHEADDPRNMLAETRRCLRDNGWLALLEWHKREMDDGPPVEDRIAEDDLRSMASEAGFGLTNRHSLNDSQYMLIMRK